MINAKTIYDTVEELVEKYQTRDPEQLAECIGLKIFENDFEKLLGMYTSLDGHRIVILNSVMDNELRRMVLAHEIGHDILHRDAAIGFKEYTAVKTVGTTEYEANAFCAHLLLPTDDFLETIAQEKTVENIASEYNLDPNLVLIKAKELCKLGFELKNCDMYNSRFFCNTEPVSQ